MTDLGHLVGGDYFVGGGGFRRVIFIDLQVLMGEGLIFQILIELALVISNFHYKIL